jgi:RNA 3'-terminal phosphate cyclase (ATP)
MARLIPVDGSHPEGGGEVLRAALSLSMLTGQGFEMTRIGAGRARPGLRAQDVASVRAATMASGAKVGGTFEGSPDLRFEPGPLEPGEFRFDLASPAAASFVAETLLVPLATAGEGSRLEITGGTHVPGSPSFHYLSRHWGVVLADLGLHLRFELEKAGFHPAGGGEIRAEVQPWSRPAALSLEERGGLVALRGVSGASRLKGDIALRQRDAVQEQLWEKQRLDVEWELDAPGAASPGSFLYIEAIFEKSRAAFGFVGEPGVRPETLGDRAARRLLRFLEAEGAVDGYLVDQLAVPLAAAGGGGRVTTDEVTHQLETVATTLTLFGFTAETWGRRGGPGGLAVGGSS